MIGWLRSLLGMDRAATAPAAPRVRGRFDNAQWTDDNRRTWAMADTLSAKAANNFQVRRNLRMRSRYEVSNNPYLFGVVNGNADDLVGTGPTLQCLRTSAADNRQVEAAWREWADEVELTEKLRTLKLGKSVDGEGFLVLKTVGDMEHPVQLYPVDVEADQVTTPAPVSLQELWVDGLILHPVTGRPVAYDVLRHHPGDYFFPGLNPLAVDRLRAAFVVHWFPKFRPGQVRGVPVFTPALDLFAELRAYRRAVLSKAQIAANLTAVLESEAPADDEGAFTGTPFETLQIDRGTMTTLPAGAKLHQYDAGEPGTTYEMFHEKCLGEAIRPLAYPLNLALGSSQKFNFSSARLDHVNYRNSLIVERAECDRVVLDRLFRAWLDEAVMIPGLLPRGVARLADVPHEWHWPGFAPLDPVQDATADHARLSNGTATLAEFWASRGYDWREVLAQQAAEKTEIERLGLVFGEPLTKTETETQVSAPPPRDAEASRPQRIRAGGDFDEDKHPRDDHGRWGDGGGDAGAADKGGQRPAAHLADNATRSQAVHPPDRQLDPAFRDQVKTLDKDAQGAFHAYSASQYWSINSALRDGAALKPDDLAVAAKLDKAFAATKSFDHPVLTWRGIDGQPGLGKAFAAAQKSGQPVTMPSFTSTSLNPAAASSFAKKDGVVLEIKATKGMYLPPVARLPGERELMLPRAAQFKVTGVKTVKFHDGAKAYTRTVVQLEQLHSTAPPPPLNKGGLLSGLRRLFARKAGGRDKFVGDAAEIYVAAEASPAGATK